MLNYKQNNQYKSQFMLPKAEQKQRKQTAKEIFPPSQLVNTQQRLAIYLFITMVLECCGEEKRRLSLDTSWVCLASQPQIAASQGRTGREGASLPPLMSEEMQTRLPFTQKCSWGGTPMGGHCGHSAPKADWCPHMWLWVHRLSSALFPFRLFSPQVHLNLPSSPWPFFSTVSLSICFPLSLTSLNGCTFTCCISSLSWDKGSPTSGCRCALVSAWSS